MNGRRSQSMFLISTLSVTMAAGFGTVSARAADAVRAPEPVVSHDAGCTTKASTRMASP